MKRLEEKAHGVPAHPADAGRDALERLGMLSPQEAAVQACLQAGSPSETRLARERGVLPPGGPSEDALAPGLDLLATIDEADSDDLRFDAFVGEAAPAPAGFSPSRLERLGACPQHYFFRHVLRVEELEEVLEPHELDAREIGSGVHDVLRDVYAAIAGPDGSLPAEASETALSRAAAETRAAWTRRLGALARRVSARYPLLWSAVEDLWLGAIERFVRRDLQRLIAERTRIVGLERPVGGRVPLGAGRPGVEVHGRLDRLTIGGGGLVVADYKTSARLKDHVAIGEILRGTRLQMPAYLLLLESLAREGLVERPPSRGEILGVGPKSEGGPGAEDDSRVELEVATLERFRDGVSETLSTLVDLAATGSYPLNPKSALCDICPYTRACRRRHVPTVARVTAAAGGRDYSLLRRKSSHAPLLRDVRTEGAPEVEA